MIAPEKQLSGSRAQGVRQAPLSQFDLESVFALGLCTVQRRFRSLAEGRIVCTLAG